MDAVFLAPNGAPYCFDDAGDYHGGDDLAELCESCPLEYQAEMLLARRCFSPVAELTPVARLRAKVPDAVNVRALLEQVRIGFPSDQFIPWYQR